jgi:hypothetical protein
MNNKLQLYSELAERAAGRLTNSRENWTSYLTTAGRLYKYPFDEQLMIYAQRPDATACAPLETWNTPMNRYVKRGSKGIALIDKSGWKPQLKYVFDYADTEDGRRNPKRPVIWELREDHNTLVMNALADAYGIGEGNLAEIIHKIAFNLATDYCNEHGEELKERAIGSYLEDYDDDSLYTAYVDAITVSGLSYGSCARIITRL